MLLVTVGFVPYILLEDPDYIGNERYDAEDLTVEENTLISNPDSINIHEELSSSVWNIESVSIQNYLPHIITNIDLHDYIIQDDLIRL